jgi:hypothetical protein
MSGCIVFVVAVVVILLGAVVAGIVEVLLFFTVVTVAGFDVKDEDGNLPVDFFHNTIINVMIGILKVVFTCVAILSTNKYISCCCPITCCPLSLIGTLCISVYQK